MASMLRVFSRRYSSATNEAFLKQAMRKQMGQDAGSSEADLWKKIFLFVAVPVMGFCTYNGFFSAEAQHEHEQPEFVPYSHLRIRIRAFPWGDGNHSLFHSHYNALPEGYEEEH